MSQNDVFVIKQGFESIRFLDQKIKEFDSKINQNLKGMQKEMEIMMSIPGVGFTTAAAVMAEIGNIEEFSKRISSFQNLFQYRTLVSML